MEVAQYTLSESFLFNALKEKFKNDFEISLKNENFKISQQDILTIVEVRGLSFTESIRIGDRFIKEFEEDFNYKYNEDKKEDWPDVYFTFDKLRTARNGFDIAVYSYPKSTL